MEMRTVSDILGLWDSDAEFARDVGIKPTHAQVMKLRGSIPPPYWPAIVKAASKRGYPITLEVLAKIAALKPRERAKAS